MKFILTTYHYLSFIIKVLLLLIISPFFFLFLYIKRQIYLYHFKKQLSKAGLKRDAIKSLSAATLKYRDIMKMIKQPHSIQKNSI